MFLPGNLQPMAGFRKRNRQTDQLSQKILLTSVIPAYQELMTGIKRTKNSGSTSRGLKHFEGGTEYYRYLLQSQTGCYLSVEKIQQRLAAQLSEDMDTVQKMLNEQPSLLPKLTKGV